MARSAPIIPPGGETSDSALRQFIGYDMKRAFNALQADLVRTLEPFGLRMITYSTLAMIVQNPGLRPSHLAAGLSIERANLVVIVDELEQRELVTRTTSLQDRRAHALTATLEGQKLYRDATEAVAAHDRLVTSGLSDPERTALRRALRQIEATARGQGG